MVNPNDDTIIHSLFGGVMALGGIIVNFYRKKIEHLESNHRTYVSRGELDDRFKSMQDERQRMHQENRESIRELASDIRALHARIDESLR